MPAVSCIVNCYNGETYLRQALDSIFAQTFEDWEIVFLDNCSTDASGDIAKSYGQKVRYFRTNETILLYAARNEALKNVTGEATTFLDTDDLWYPEFLEVMYGGIRQGQSFVYCGTDFIDGQGHSIHTTLPYQPFTHITVNRLFIKNVIPMNGVMVRSELLKSLKFNPEFNIVGDFDMWIRLVINGHIPVHIGHTLASYRQHGTNWSLRSSHQHSVAEKRQLCRNFIADFGLRYPGAFFYRLKGEIKYFLKLKPF